MLATLPSDEIDALLRQRPLEDTQRLDRVEQVLRGRRGHVFRMPDPGSPVILPFSGGLATTLTAALLLDHYGLDIYPVYVERGHPCESAEKAAMKRLAGFFQQRHASRFHEPLSLESALPADAIRPAFDEVIDRPMVEGGTQLWGVPLFSCLLSMLVSQAAYFHELTEGLRLRTIVCAFGKNSGEVIADATLTALRGINLGICLITHDFSWQITSLLIERELGFFYDPNVLIAAAVELGVPLHETRSSCPAAGARHCGRCRVCRARRNAFAAAGYEDKTEYSDPKEAG